MYDKGNAIHNNGAKLGQSVEQMNQIKKALAAGVAVHSKPNGAAMPQHVVKPLTSPGK